MNYALPLMTSILLIWISLAIIFAIIYNIIKYSYIRWKRLHTLWKPIETERGGTWNDADES